MYPITVGKLYEMVVVRQANLETNLAASSSGGMNVLVRLLPETEQEENAPYLNNDTFDPRNFHSMFYRNNAFAVQHPNDPSVLIVKTVPEMVSYRASHLGTGYYNGLRFRVQYVDGNIKLLPENRDFLTDSWLGKEFVDESDTEDFFDVPVQSA